MVRPSASQEILLEEWKEAGSSIGRFDEYLPNLFNKSLDCAVD